MEDLNEEYHGYYRPNGIEEDDHNVLVSSYLGLGGPA